jgi:hypothetical protein
MSSNPQTHQYLHFLKDIKDRIRSAQYEASKSVNKELIGLYWDIGLKIVERQKSEGWGKSKSFLDYMNAPRERGCFQREKC